MSLLAGCVTLYLTATVLCLPDVIIVFRQPQVCFGEDHLQHAGRVEKNGQSRHMASSSLCLPLRPLFAAPYLHPARRGASGGLRPGKNPRYGAQRLDAAGWGRFAGREPNGSLPNSCSGVASGSKAQNLCFHVRSHGRDRRDD